MTRALAWCPLCPEKIWFLAGDPKDRLAVQNILRAHLLHDHEVCADDAHRLAAATLLPPRRTPPLQQ